MTSDHNIDLPKRKRNKDDGELDVTPMIDVTFLLLAFFVVVSKMDPQAAVELPKASYGESIPEKNCVTLIVVVDKEDEKKISIFKGRSMGDDTRIADGEEEAQEEEIGNFVEAELVAYPTKQAILIKAAGMVKTGMVEMVKRGVGQSELAKSRKIYVGIEEEQ